MTLTRRFRTFMKFVTIKVGALAASSIIWPQAFSGGAYAWVLGLIPLPIFSALWVLLCLAGTYMLNMRTHRQLVGLTIGWLGLYTVIQFLFALSIFTLTWQGAYGAFAGSLMWGGYAWLGWQGLRGHTERDAVSVQDQIDAIARRYGVEAEECQTCSEGT